MTVSASTRRLLRERATGFCELCGKNPATNAHHRKNRSQGGGDELSNLLLLCGSGASGCHGRVTENPAEAYENGWSVHSYDYPGARRVLYHGTWVLLDDRGNISATVDGKGVARCH